MVIISGVPIFRIFTVCYNSAVSLHGMDSIQIYHQKYHFLSLGDGISKLQAGMQENLAR